MKPAFLLMLLAIGCSDPVKKETVMFSTAKLPLSTVFEATPAPAGHRLPRLPVPTKCPPSSSEPCWAVFQINGDVPRIGADPAEVTKFLNEIWNPTYVIYYGIQDGMLIDRGDMNQGAAKHFQIDDPPEARHGRYVVGHFSDPPPKELTKDQQEILRNRVLAALDILVPLFLSSDPHQTRSEAANLALLEIQDFFPLVAEPGLWQFYQAEGREFFKWVWDRVPHRQHAPIPWESR